MISLFHFTIAYTNLQDPVQVKHKNNNITKISNRYQIKTNRDVYLFNNLNLSAADQTKQNVLHLLPKPKTLLTSEGREFQ